ncbi:MAG: DUF1667 domain-containing protein [Clostridia bacterium]|nr:DUF1667 domain-containing protein [Clostridia bacterium]
MRKRIICTECPLGCEVEVELTNGEVSNVIGNGCIRGKIYATNETLSPKRMVTTTMRTDNGVMVPVKTSIPVDKTLVFDVIKLINKSTVKLPIKIGQILIKDVIDGVDIISTACLE